ncbi:putative secreted protein (Por secretion system target) [Winogradskyella eximia]|uniref:Putative secreted protein (Por secretion system target) n=1 Tax=Winogradskyella eximia TaxID=262006 RepID=A0A3D9HCS8_9FLAO|nr:T9SS type A sorting domain-containing protein [Winogradskyella eximia]RED47051.1 putative secreted protein (Por secretion system target) [Winogradskyella eximia]
MKKTYVFYLLVTLFSLGFSQTPIVTIDRANITGPTTTGNDPSISSTGFTRGSGIDLSNPGAANHTSNHWDATTQADAVTNNEYIEWSVTASADNSIEITEFDIITRRNTDGPASWQVFYSLDNFSTAGIALIPVQANPTTATAENFNGLSVNSGTAGTITFRLYAWNAANANHWFRIPGRGAWSAYGISSPGLRLIGNITTTSVNSTDSDIIATSFNPSDNIDYSTYSTTSGLTISNSIKVGEFTIRDGGSTLSDTDALPTILNDLEFNITNSDLIATLAIFDGALNVTETSVTSDTATFSGIPSLSALDNSSKTFDVYATFKSFVIDNTQFQLSIATASADVTNGSSFDAFDAGGAQTPINGDDNRIEVTASANIFGQQPIDVNQFETMKPFPTILAVDSNGNQDLDYNNSVTILSTDGDLEPSFIIYPIINGIATLNTLVFTKREVVAFLVAIGNPLASATSASFNVNGPLINIAKQDFDGFTPEWTYTTNTTTFDNGWGVDGYYGVIDSAIASPLDNVDFSNNIFGENDLDDEGNGASGYATLAFHPIDISAFDNARLTFDWDIHGYDNNSDDAQYRLIYDGVNQPLVFLLNGNDGIETDQGTVTIDIPNTVNTIALEIRVRNDGENGYSGFDNFRLSSVFDGLIYVDDGTSVGWEPSAPDNTTGSQNAYVYSGTYNVGTNIQINDFFIRNGATTTVSAGQSITANAGIRNNGTLELNSVSTSYSSLITDKVYGDVIYNRHVNNNDSDSATGNNDLVSAPVTNANQTVAVLTANNPIPTGTIGGVPSVLFGPFDNGINNYINYPTADVTTVLTAGTGYRTASDSNLYPTGTTFEFVGNVETGTLAVPIAVGASSRSNLIGNPYPSYITLSSFLAANNTQFNPTSSGIYGYIGNITTGFKVWNQAYSDAHPTAKITPGQGFFVNSKTGGGTINFTPAMRTIGTTDDFIAGRSANLNLAYANLQISKGQDLYQTDIYFNDNATLSMDAGYDAEMINNTAPSFAIYSHLVEDNLGNDLAAQSVSFTDLENVTIPLGINIAQGEQAVISISESDFPEDTSVILEDNISNTFTNLLESDYTFTSSTTLNDTGRFYVHFSRSTLGINENIVNGLEIYSNATSRSIEVKGQLNNLTTLRLYDIQGRLIKSNILDSKQTENSMDVSDLTTGIYIVELQNTSGVLKTQKVIIK